MAAVHFHSELLAVGVTGGGCEADAQLHPSVRTGLLLLQRSMNGIFITKL